MNTKEEDLPEGLRSLIQSWEDGDISEDAMPALERVLKDLNEPDAVKTVKSLSAELRPYARKVAKVGLSGMPPGAMGACSAPESAVEPEPRVKEDLDDYREQVHSMPHEKAGTHHVHHSLYEQRKDLHDIYLGIRVQVDNAKEILGILDGFIKGPQLVGNKGDCDKECSMEENMPAIIRSLRSQEETLTIALAGIRLALDGGPGLEGYDARKTAR